MYGLDRLTKVFKESRLIPFNNSTKIVLMSDCHRGDGSAADNFLKNKRNYCEALDYYFNNGYIYIEIGDGDELWENKSLSMIIDVHKDVFIRLSEFYKRKRLYFIYGNHDMVKKDDRFLQEHLYYYERTNDNRIKYNRTKYNSESDRNVIIDNTLFENIKVFESLVLTHNETGKKIFLVHGHQVDFINDKLWKLSRFLVRYLWKPIEIIGIRDPTSASQNFRKKKVVEDILMEWCERNKCILVAGHTHKPVFANEGEILYFNSGSCVKNDGITAIEIAEGRITLVTWKEKIKDHTKTVIRDIVAGPKRLEEY